MIETGAESRDPAGAADLEDARLAEVVEEYRAALKEGRRPDRAALLARYPAQADALAERLDALDFLDSAARQLPEAAPGAAGFNPAALGDYRIVREVGRGGMGIVYEAEQLSLGRRVALKVLPFAATMDPRQLQRFQNEARAAACLQHPHIVPVYAVGSERGVHFYAMQFIDGQPLEAMIRELRSAADPAGETLTPPQASPDSTTDEPAPESRGVYPRGLGPRGVEPRGSLARADTAEGPRARATTERSARDPRHFRRAAKLGAQAAEALEYAHTLGIVHRDVKPANLLIDARGQLWVADFGLARTASDSGLTVSGDLLGTLRYMSPEQALAKHGLVDHRTDVYSLGATLYELLTLRPAVDGRDREEILRKIAFDEPAPPRRLNRAIPADLETVVLKAMAKNPAERYATAGELADDLRRFLEDKPILARRPTLRQRLVKWSRRHRALVAASSSVLAIALVALAVSSFFIAAAYREEAAQRQEAEENYRIALRAADDLYSQAARRWLADEPLEEETQREFLEKALRLYQGFADKRGGDPALRLETAKAHVRVGDIQKRFGHYKEAEAAYLQAIPLLEKLVAEGHASDEVQREQGFCYDHLANLWAETGRPGKAEEAYRKAGDILGRLAAGFPTGENRRELAIHHNQWGLFLRLLGRHGEAMKAFRRSVELDSTLAAELPKKTDHSYGAAVASLNLARVLEDTGRVAEAEKALLQSKGLCEGLVKESPGRAKYRHLLGLHLLNRGTLHLAAGRLGEGERDSRAAKDLFARLVADFPRALRYRRDLTGSINNLAVVLSDAGRRGETTEVWDEIVKRQEALVKEFPANPQHRSHLGDALHNFAQFLREQGRHQDAEGLFRRALTISQQLAGELPVIPGYRDAHASSLSVLALLLHNCGRLPEAEELVGRALVLRRQLAADFPEVVRYRSTLAGTLDDLGVRLRGTGRLKEAEDHHRKALAIRRELAAEFPGHPGYRSALGAVVHNLAQVLMERKELRQARELLEEAIDHQQAALDSSPEHRTYRHFLRNHHHIMGEVLHVLGDRPLAEKFLRRGVDIGESLLADAPKDPGYLRASGDCYHDLGILLAQQPTRLEDAAAVHRKAVEVRERLLAVTQDSLHDRNNLAESLTHLGSALKRSGQRPEAAEIHRKAVDLREKLAAEVPDGPDFQRNLAGALSNLAVELHHRKDTAEARRLLERALGHQRAALKVQPNHPGSRRFLRNHYTALADVLLDLRDHAGLARVGSEWLRDFPEDPQACYKAARCAVMSCVLLGDDKRLSEDERQALGQTYAEQATEAVRHTSRFCERDPKAQCQLAWLVISYPDPPPSTLAAALELAEKSASLAPKIGEAWRVLGIARYRAGKWDGAREALEKADQLTPTDKGPTWLFLAMAHLQLGDREKAGSYRDRADRWIQENGAAIARNPAFAAEVQRFRAEAAQLLGKDAKKQ